jgi:hypothetical protein
MTKYAIIPALFVLAGGALLLHAATDSGSLQADREAIIQAAHDYVDGFYEGKAERMERALHPDVAKRNIVTDRETGAQSVRNVTAQHLIEITAAGRGKQIAQRDGRQCDVTILDIYHDVATVKIVAITWIDYLHVARVDGEWKIINVLWAWKPTGETQ